MKLFLQPSKLVGLVLILGSTLLFAADEDGFKSLFNGKDLTGWDGNPELWSVRDGALTGQTTAEKPTKGNTFIFWRDGLVDDFELRLSYRLIGNNPDKWGNSGVQYRSVDKGNWVASGYQADIETGTNYSGIMYEEGGRGILALRGQQVVVGNDGKPKVIGSLGKSEDIQAAIKSEDWNEYIIIARGFHLIHKINGRTTMELTDEDVAKRMRSGILALQLHAGKPMTVQFKDIRLKRLPMADVKEKQ